jgi:hypothetical protein
MRRLEYQRKVRAARFKGGDSTEAILFLAQIVRERRRLEQERHSLMQRVGRINSRLDEIGSTETKIVPTIKVAAEADAPAKVPTVNVASVPDASPKVAVVRPAMERPSYILPTAFSEFTLQY